MPLSCPLSESMDTLFRKYIICKRGAQSSRLQGDACTCTMPSEWQNGTCGVVFILHEVLLLYLFVRGRE